MSVDIQRTLINTKKIIESRGWKQSPANREGGPVCAIVAVALAMDFDETLTRRQRHDLFGQVCELLADQVSTPTFMDYNDEPGRTKEEVIEMISSAQDSINETAQRILADAGLPVNRQ